MTPLIRTAIGFTTLILLVVVPLAAFISRSRAKVNVGLYWVVLYPLWYLSSTVFHEGAHYIVNILTGVHVTGVRLIPHFWRGDFADAYVDTDPWNPFQAAVGSTAPYWFGLASVACGLLLLKLLKGKPLLLAALVLTVFCLRPLADLVNNYVAELAFNFGDFSMAAGAIGYPLMHLSALGMLALTVSGCAYGVYHTPQQPAP